METTVFLERMTRPQVERALVEGFAEVIVPCGSVEQHGPHLPLFVDSEIGSRLGVEVARRLGKILVAPTIRIGCSEHHMDFAGSLTLRHSTFKSVCLDYCTSLARHGFERIILLPSHGGNFEPLADSVVEFDAAVGEDCSVEAFTDLVAIVELWSSIVESEVGHGNRVGGHADIAESSIMLCLYPDLVDRDLARAGFDSELTEGLVERIMREGMKSITSNGILGDARGMSADLGKRLIDETADMIAEHFRRRP